MDKFRPFYVLAIVYLMLVLVVVTLLQPTERVSFILTLLIGSAVVTGLTVLSDKLISRNQLNSELKVVKHVRHVATFMWSHQYPYLETSLKYVLGVLDDICTPDTAWPLIDKFTTQDGVVGVKIEWQSGDTQVKIEVLPLDVYWHVQQGNNYYSAASWDKAIPEQWIGSVIADISKEVHV